MSSKENQYYKINGRCVGDVDIDEYIAVSHGVPSCFFACARASVASLRTVPSVRCG